MSKSPKNARYTMRLNRDTLNRLKLISAQLGTPLSDLLIVSALITFSRATSPQAYYTLKASTFESISEAPYQVDIEDTL